jgi:TRAP-type mannitol/chloroaromatic compound transport system permease small subunit
VRHAAVLFCKKGRPMRPLIAIAAGIDRLTEWCAKLNILIVTALIAIGFLNVVGRFSGRFVGMRLTSNAIIELQWYMFSILFFLSFSYVLKHNLNVRVDFLYAKWTPKRKALVDIIGHLLFFIPFCIIGIYVSYGPVMRSWGLLPDGTFGQWELSPDPDGLPRAPIKTMIIVSFVLLLLQLFAEIIKKIGVLKEVIPPEVAFEDASDAALAEQLVREFKETHKQ